MSLLRDEKQLLCPPPAPGQLLASLETISSLMADEASERCQRQIGRSLTFQKPCLSLTLEGGVEKMSPSWEGATLWKSRSNRLSSL